ncbi:hypothetical protein Gotur_001123 [Gossypium turneri]
MLEKLKRRDFFVLISFLKHPSFQNLLSQAEEEYGIMLWVEEAFIELTCNLQSS